MADYVYRDGELMHYGVLGMKWGIRRARPSSGGKKRTLSRRQKKKMQKAV